MKEQNVNVSNNVGITALNPVQPDNGHIKCVEALIKAGADVNATNKDDMSALMKTALEGHGNCVQTLITAGADVNLRNSKETTCLMKAAFSGDKNIVEALIQAGANVNASNVDGVTALIEAASTGKSECVKSLIKAGADINASDTNEVSPLMHASFTGYNQCLASLIKAGANVNAKDVDGVTALMHATFKFSEIYDVASLEVAAGKTPRFFTDPKKNTLNRLPNDVNMDIKDGGIGLMPTTSPVLRNIKSIDEINDAKPQVKPKHPTFFTLPLKPGKISTALLAMKKKS